MLNAELIEKNKQTFIGFYNQYIAPRIGQQLLGYLLSTDFFTAPLTRDGILSEKGWIMPTCNQYIQGDGKDLWRIIQKLYKL